MPPECPWCGKDRDDEHTCKPEDIVANVHAHQDDKLRRDMFAAAALTGLLTHQFYKDATVNVVAEDAVYHADALIAELDKPVTP